MRFVNENARPMRFRDISQLAQFSEVAVHRINSFHDYKLAASTFAGQSGVERRRIVVLELFGPTTRKHGAIAQTEMRPIIKNGDVALTKQPGDRAERTAKSAVEKHCVFAPQKFGDSRFEFAMKIGHAGEHGRAASPETVRV